MLAVEYYLHELVCENETDLSRFLFSTMYILHLHCMHMFVFVAKR